MTLTYTYSEQSSTYVYVLTGTDGTAETFDAATGRIESFTDADGNVTHYNYPDGVLTSIVAPDNQTTSFYYNNGLLASITNVVTSTGVVIGTTWLGYNASGQLTSVTEPNPANGSKDTASPVTAFGYNGSGQLTSMTDPDGNRIDYGYDFAGTLHTITYSDGSCLTYRSAEVAGLVDPSTGGLGTSSDPASLLPTAVVRAVAYDESQNPTLYTFDSYGNVTSVEDPLGNTTLYDRDYKVWNVDTGLVIEMDQPSVSNGGSPTTPVTTYHYDSDGNLTKETLPDGTEEQWYYDDSPTDATTDVYIDELSSSTLCTGTTSYTYDSSGNLLSAEQFANGSTADPAVNPITSYTYTSSGNDFSGAPLGLVTSVTDPDGNVTTYSYDAGGNITASNQSGLLTTTVYDSRENVLSQTDPAGDVTAYTYDDLNRPLTTSQGQTMPVAVVNGAVTATFANLPQSPGRDRTYEVYVQSSLTPNGSYTITDGTTTVTLTGPFSSATPLGSNWYDLGPVTLPASDVSSGLTVTCPSATPFRRSPGWSRRRPPCTMLWAMSSPRPTAWAMSRPMRTTTSSRTFRPHKARPSMSLAARPRSPICRRRPARPGPTQST